jgi:hypothetical protein
MSSFLNNTASLADKTDSGNIHVCSSLEAFSKGNHAPLQGSSADAVHPLAQACTWQYDGITRQELIYRATGPVRTASILPPFPFKIAPSDAGQLLTASSLPGFQPVPPVFLNSSRSSVQSRRGSQVHDGLQQAVEVGEVGIQAANEMSAPPWGGVNAAKVRRSSLNSTDVSGVMAEDPSGESLLLVRRHRGVNGSTEKGSWHRDAFLC